MPARDENQDGGKAAIGWRVGLGQGGRLSSEAFCAGFPGMQNSLLNGSLAQTRGRGRPSCPGRGFCLLVRRARAGNGAPTLAI